MSYDPNFPLNDGHGQNNPEPEDENRTVSMQRNFDAPAAGFPPSDYDTPTVVYGQPEPSAIPGVDFSQTPVQPAMPFQGNLPPATTGSSKKRPSNKMLLIGGVSILVLLILIIGVLMILPNLTANASNQAPVAAASPTVTATRTATKNIYTPYLAQYRSTIRNQIAQGLHLPVDQLVSRLNGGGTLSSIASAQGISSSQLQTIVTTAFQQGFQPAVSNGKLTQKQVNVLINRMLKQSKTLDRYLNVPAKNGTKSKATPTPTV